MANSDSVLGVNASHGGNSSSCANLSSLDRSKRGDPSASGEWVRSAGRWTWPQSQRPREHRQVQRTSLKTSERRLMSSFLFLRRLSCFYFPFLPKRPRTGADNRTSTFYTRWRPASTNRISRSCKATTCTVLFSTLSLSPQLRRISGFN